MYGLSGIVCRDVNGTRQCINESYGTFETLFPPAPSEPLPCNPTDEELERYGGRSTWNNLAADQKYQIGLTICSRRPSYGSVLTLPQRLGWSRGLTADEIAQAAAGNDAVRDYVNLAHGGSPEAAADALAGKSLAEVNADIEQVLGYYGVPLQQGGVAVGEPYTGTVQPAGDAGAAPSVSLPSAGVASPAGDTLSTLETAALVAGGFFLLLKLTKKKNP